MWQAHITSTHWPMVAGFSLPMGDDTKKRRQNW